MTEAAEAIPMVNEPTPQELSDMIAQHMAAASALGDQLRYRLEQQIEQLRSTAQIVAAQKHTVMKQGVIDEARVLMGSLGELMERLERLRQRAPEAGEK